MATRDISPPSWFAKEWIDDMVMFLKAWRPLAVRNGNNTLVEMTDHAISTQDPFELESTRMLFVDMWLAGELD